ncbi:MAG: type II secretion system protein GspF [Planctomycetes bacterium]|nr:type II secretion system protein GspF [Planctomycetota bacterium]
MPIYDYKAIDIAGKPRRGIMDADSPRAARTKLRADGVHVIDIATLEERKKESVMRRSLFTPRGDPRQLAVVTRQFATLLTAGISVVDALKAMIGQVESKDFERVLRDVRERVTQGDMLADALSHHPQWFNDLYVNMVRAGEASGQMDAILSRLSIYITRQNRLRSKLTAALTYPMVMIIVGVLVVVVLMTFVVPNLTSLFAKVGKALPAITQALIAISKFFQYYWWSIPLAAFLVWLGLKNMRRSPEGRVRFDRLLMKVPVLGDLVRKTAISRFATTMATLLKSGIPVLDALKIVQMVVQNAVLAQTIGDVHKSILEGSDISTPLQASGVFPPMVGYMIATGEQSGQLEDLLENISEAYDEEIDLATQRLTSVLEPVIIIALALVVLFVVAAIIMPLMQMGSLVRRG